MSIEAINEQLLRATGVGVALLDGETFNFTFHNETFQEWFGNPNEAGSLVEIFQELDPDQLRKTLKESGRFMVQTKFKKKRRTMTIALDFTTAKEGEQNVALLVCQNITRIKELEAMIASYSTMVERNTREIMREKEQAEKILLNILPRSDYEELQTLGAATPQRYDPVSVLALDFVDCTDNVMSEPDVAVTELSDIYGAFDRIGDQFGCKRIKTIGDTYIIVAGLPDAAPDHENVVANTAIRFLRYLERRNNSHPNRWCCRIGLSSGFVIGSIVGKQKHIYDMFGPTVTLSSRLQEFSKPMQISVQDEIAKKLHHQFEFESRGIQKIYGFSDQEVWHLCSR